MANKKISELPAFSGSIDDNDVLVILDHSDSKTKKIGLGAVRNKLAPNISVVAEVDGSSGSPSVEVSESGTPTEPEYTFSFQGLKGPPGAASNDAITFTYIVDSNQALLDWANNATGNDYTNVLIKRGTWTLTKGIVLDTVGTKHVYGEPGSKIFVDFLTTLSGNFYCFSNNNSPGVSAEMIDSNLYDTWIHNVNIEISDRVSTSASGTIGGFTKVANLSNCSVYIHRDGSTGGKASHIGFSSCWFLDQCQAKISNSRGNGFGYRYCYNLTNCLAVNTAFGTACGYGTCQYLSNCKAYVKRNYTSVTEGVGSSYGYQNCEYLTSCFGSVVSSSSSYTNGVGCYNCVGISNCYMSGAYAGFYNCYRVHICVGISYSSSYPAFRDCQTVIGCYSPTGFVSSYASATSTYTCADTPNGGFNTTQ